LRLVSADVCSAVDFAATGTNGLVLGKKVGVGAGVGEVVYLYRLYLVGYLGGGREGRGEWGVDTIQTKQKRVAREQRNKYKPSTETGKTPSNQTCRQAGGFFTVVDVYISNFLMVKSLFGCCKHPHLTTWRLSGDPCVQPSSGRLAGGFARLGQRLGSAWFQWPWGYPNSWMVYDGKSMAIPCIHG